MKKIVFALCAAVTMSLLSACIATPMFNAPFDKATVQAAGKNAAQFEGDWSTKDLDYTLRITRHKPGNADDPALAITVTELKETPDHLTVPQDIPVLGIPCKIGDDLYVCFILNMDLVSEKSNFSNTICAMVRPYFYLAKPEMQDDGTLKVSMIAWTRKEKGSDGKEKNVPSDPAVKLDSPEGFLVMNSTPELIKLVQEKKYVVHKELTFIKKGKLKK